jgi:hypothetical protein
LGTEGKRMHIDRADQITVSREPAGAACPISSLGLVCTPTARTPARCSSFGAGEAQDMGLFGFVAEIVDVLAIFPQGHTLIVISATVPVAYPMRVANESVPTSCFTQKLITALVALWRASRIRRSALRLTLFLARCNVFHRREYFLHRLCFLASCPNWRQCCRLRERMPRPVTIKAAPVFVVTAAR